MKAEGKAVLITGASTGIGRACALTLDRAGLRVFAGIRKDSDGEALQSEASWRLTPIRLDVTREEDIGAAVRLVDEATGSSGSSGLWGLVNNAGIVVAGALEFLETSELRRQFEVNVFGLHAVTRAFLPAIRRARGRVVHVGSTSGVFSAPFLGPYCASKFAVEALTDSLRMELAPWGIHVAVVQPGTIATPIWDKTRAQSTDQRKAMPEGCEELYGPAFDAVEAASHKLAANGSPPQCVADAVLHALTARRPKARYPVGANSTVELLLARFAPARLTDWLIRRHLAIPAPAVQTSDTGS